MPGFHVLPIIPESLSDYLYGFFAIRPICYSIGKIILEQIGLENFWVSKNPILDAMICANDSKIVMGQSLNVTHTSSFNYVRINARTQRGIFKVE
jgi:hypothetical protein